MGRNVALLFGWVVLFAVAGVTVAEAQSITGTWNVTEIADESAFGDGFVVYEYEITISQDGVGYIVSTPEGTFDVTASGNEFWWAASYPEDGGTTTVPEIRFEVSPDYTTCSGTSSWSWTDGIESGEGTSVFSATKVSLVSEGGSGHGRGGDCYIDTARPSEPGQPFTLFIIPCLIGALLLSARRSLRIIQTLIAATRHSQP
ncbi:MAG: hypothetical protein A2Z34_11125 [Planctomycetes bacterium RBG_16_59_8]|nr:MAG: hypothetical protein A2Z34_11125 [Planctomycetes bacterium RBG_16_59_8]